MFLVSLVLLGFFAGCSDADRQLREASHKFAERQFLKENSRGPFFFDADAARIFGLENPDTGEFSRALRDPAWFRKLDRRQRFQTLAFAGDPARAEPLLRHLLDRGDWQPVFLTDTAVFWRRGGDGDFALPHLEPLRKLAREEGPESEARFLARLGARLSSVGWNEAAERFFEQALELAPQLPAAQIQAATHYARREKWKAAEASAKAALANEPRNAAALSVLTQALLAQKQPAAAYDAAHRLIRTSSQTPRHLFLHARAAHAAGDFDAEIASLRQLVSLAEEAGEPSASYRIYLAQAHSANGEAERALEELAALREEPDLSENNRRWVERAFKHLEDQLHSQAAAPPLRDRAAR